MAKEGGRLAESGAKYILKRYLVDKNNDDQHKYLSIFDYFLENIRSEPVLIFGSSSQMTSIDPTNPMLIHAIIS
jgi:hypothetical protein